MMQVNFSCVARMHHKRLCLAKSPNYARQHFQVRLHIEHYMPTILLRESPVIRLEHAKGGISKSIFFHACSQDVSLVESSRSSAISFGWWVAMSPLGGKYTGPVR